MAGSSLSSAAAESEVAALKDALSAQQRALQKLQGELEKEREASASAASEALSMILRLQGERAAEKMEAHQYKRMAEEKMQLADNSLTVFEELMHKKEMEVASLEFQVEAYRQKLSSVGFINLGIADMKFADHGTVRRNASLPVTNFKGSKSKTGGVDNVPSTSLPQDTDDNVGCICEEIDESIKESSPNRTLNEVSQSKWDSANEKARETDETYSESSSKTMSSCSIYQAEDSEKPLQLDAASNQCLGTAVAETPIPSTSIHDIFKIPKKHDIQELLERNKMKQMALPEAENRNGKADSVQCENGKCHFKDENQWIKKAVLYTTDWNKKSTQQNRLKIEYLLPHFDPKIGITPPQAEVQQLNKRMQLIEDEIRDMKNESSEKSDAELKLLTEICDQIKMIRSELRTMKAKKSSPDDSVMVSVMEAMLHYSL